MRRFVLIAGLVAIFMYGALVSQRGVPVAAAPYAVAAKAPAQALGALQKGLEATGAGLSEVVITAWAEIAHPGDRDKVAKALGWAGVPPEGETRNVAARERNGRYYVTARWTLSGKAVSDWQTAAKTLQEGLERSTTAPSVTVQVGGVIQGDGLTEVANKALDALGATERQPWNDMRAASVAGRTTLLPPGPFGVNVQVAVRRDAARGETRVWVAWPALLQEY
ncbi:MAG TPA: YwmB family TATA-box binding protein [Symbiobacteriaceae bacterium]|nr:YwmB family TATA-box binding protein [Symbiobacteriaceae bacterium]